MHLILSTPLDGLSIERFARLLKSRGFARLKIHGDKEVEHKLFSKPAPDSNSNLTLIVYWPTAWLDCAVQFAPELPASACIALETEHMP